MEQMAYQLHKHFREYNFSILNLMEEVVDYAGEQVILDGHEEKIDKHSGLPIHSAHSSKTN